MTARSPLVARTVIFAELLEARVGEREAAVNAELNATLPIAKSATIPAGPTDIRERKGRPKTGPPAFEIVYLNWNSAVWVWFPSPRETINVLQWPL